MKSATLFDRAEKGLSSAVSKLKRRGAGMWDFDVPGPTAWQGFASVRDLWLCLRAVPRETLVALPGSDHWSWLEFNRDLPAGAKVLLGERSAVEIGAELPLDAGSDLRADVRHFSTALGMAALVLTRGRSALDHAIPGAPASWALPGDVARMVSDSGWGECSTRDGGQLAVSLEVADDFCQARIEDSGEGGIRFSTEILGQDCRLAHETCQEAVAVLLLMASAATPTVRGIARVNGKTTVEAEAVVPAPVTQEGINHGLCALSTFCHTTRREVAMLIEDRDLAETYLEVLGRRRNGRHRSTR